MGFMNFSIWNPFLLQLGQKTVLFMMFVKPCRRGLENLMLLYVFLCFSLGIADVKKTGRFQSINSATYNDTEWCY